MKNFLFAFVIIFLSGECAAQKFIALDIFKMTGFKRLRYYEKDNMTFRVKEEKNKYSGKISSISDSSFTISGKEFLLKNIRVVCVDRSNFVTSALSKLCMGFGIMFIGLDIFNNTTNGTAPVVKKPVILEGSSLILAGYILKISMKRRYKIDNSGRILKVIDVTF